MALSLFRSKNITAFVHALPKIKVNLFQKIYQKIFSFIHKKTYLVTSSPNLKDSILSSTGLNAKVVPFCVQDTYDMVHEPEDELPALPKRYCLYIGRFAKYKGIDMITAAASILPNVSFVVAGDGELRDLLLQAKSRNLIVINKSVSDSTKEYLINKCEFLLFHQAQ